MRYTSLSHRLRAVEAQFGRPNQILRIIGGLPQAPVPDPQPKDTQPQPCQPASKPDKPASSRLATAARWSVPRE
jgi:hypothetical protein